MTVSGTSVHVGSPQAEQTPCKGYIDTPKRPHPHVAIEERCQYGYTLDVEPPPRRYSFGSPNA